jgi:hypothetical protein
MDCDLEEFIRWIAQLNGGDAACARDWFYGTPLLELGGETAASYVLNLMAGSTG